MQSLLAVARRPAAAGLRDLAGIAAGWFFGANAAGAPVYDPATGVTYDGVSGDGTVNRNSGAESTIHGLLTMLALDADPDAGRDRPHSAVDPAPRATSLVEGESGDRRRRS